MLDDTTFIEKLDQQNALGVIAGQPKQLLEEYQPGDLSHLTNISQVVLSGMGGSALAAEFVKSWLSDRLRVPFIISRDYVLPAFVGPNTLVIASSYSGNTEETLSALHMAEERGAQIVVLSSGGKLLDAARAGGHLHVPLLADGHPHFDLPDGLQPRLAVLYGVKALAMLFEALGLATSLEDELLEASMWIDNLQTQWQSSSLADVNLAKRIAQSVAGHPVIVYGGPTLGMPTMKWKIDFNENSKNLAFYNYLPEFNHNEFLGWGHPLEHPFKVIELRSSLDHTQIQKRFDITNELLADRFLPIEVPAEGKSKLEQMLYALILGDYVSAYVAFLNGIDPTPVEMIEVLKSKLA
jgi:glucose/mannose-6-phosphate isomerase